MIRAVLVWGKRGEKILIKTQSKSRGSGLDATTLHDLPAPIASNRNKKRRKIKISQNTKKRKPCVGEWPWYTADRMTSPAPGPSLRFCSRVWRKHDGDEPAECSCKVTLIKEDARSCLQKHGWESGLQLNGTLACKNVLRHTMRKGSCFSTPEVYLSMRMRF